MKNKLAENTKEDLNNLHNTEFHDMFLNEFVRHNIALNNSSEKYVCIDNQKKLHKENSKRGFFNSAFSPFAFKIVNVPGSALEEKYSLFYEEVREPFFFIYFGRIFP